MRYTLSDRLDREAAGNVDDLLARSANAHYTQHPGWAAVPGQHDRVLFLTGERDGRIVFSALVNVRTAPLMGRVLADVFRGPAAEDAGTLLEGLARLRDELSPLRLAALRVDPYWSGETAEQVAEGLRGLGFAPMAEPPLHSASLEIPLTGDEESLMTGYRPSMRRQIRKASRMGLTVREDLDDESVERFFALYSLMAEQKSASPRSLRFLAGLRDLFREWPRAGFLLSSWLGDDLMGAIAVFTLGRRAIYAYGASSLERPGIPKSHLLHHEAMARAAARGCTVYDLGGFSEGVGAARDRTTTQKINFFKSGFGGEEVRFVPAHEMVLRPAVYKALKAASRLRR